MWKKNLWNWLRAMVELGLKSRRMDLQLRLLGNWVGFWLPKDNPKDHKVPSENILLQVPADSFQVTGSYVSNLSALSNSIHSNFFNSSSPSFFSQFLSQMSSQDPSKLDIYIAPAFNDNHPTKKPPEFISSGIDSQIHSAGFIDFAPLDSETGLAF